MSVRRELPHVRPRAAGRPGSVREGAGASPQDLTLLDPDQRQAGRRILAAAQVVGASVTTTSRVGRIRHGLRPLALERSGGTQVLPAGWGRSAPIARPVRERRPTPRVGTGAWRTAMDRIGGCTAEAAGTGQGRRGVPAPFWWTVLAGAALLAACAAPAHAQRPSSPGAPPPQAAPEPGQPRQGAPDAAPGVGADAGTPNAATPPGGIARGVIPPPRGTDPGMVEPTPPASRFPMPVIPPRGTAR